MEVLQGLTDDQKALVGCGVALFLSGGVMVLSHTIRQWFSRDASAQTYRYQSRLADAAQSRDSDGSQDRKAA